MRNTVQEAGRPVTRCWGLVELGSFDKVGLVVIKLLGSLGLQAFKLKVSVCRGFFYSGDILSTYASQKNAHIRSMQRNGCSQSEPLCKRHPDPEQDITSRPCAPLARVLPARHVPCQESTAAPAAIPMN